MSKTKLKEYLLRTNAFKEPDYFSDRKAIGLLILRLLILEPGKNKLYPAMGIGLCKKKRYIMEDKLLDLENEIHKQIATYLPKYQSATVKLELNNKKILIVYIYVGDEVYEYKVGENAATTLMTIYTKTN